MKKGFLKTASLILSIVLLFAGCGSAGQRPQAVLLKTDLNDATFTFTYGELRKVLPGDKLAMLFENVNEKTDDKTVSMSYYELVSKFGKEEYFDALTALIPDSQLALLTANQQEALDYFNGLINDLKATGEPAVTYSEDFKIDYSGVVFKDKNGNEAENQDELCAAFRIYCDTALKNSADFLMNSSEPTAFGADLTDIIGPRGEKTASMLALGDLYTPEGGYPIYSSVIPTLSYDIDESGENAKDENGEFIFVPTEYQRTIVMNVKADENSVKKAFYVSDNDVFLDEMKKAESYMTVKSITVGFAPCKITANINGVNDKMTSAVYEKNMIVTLDITFTGSLAQYGELTVEFPCTSMLEYTFGWQE